MALRIACDLDGTVADIGAALWREARHLFGEGGETGVSAKSRPDDTTASWVAASEVAQVPDAPYSMRLTQRQQDRLWRHVRESDNFWETLPEIEPGAVARFSAAAAKARWDVIFLTQRPSTAGDTVQLQSQRWLRAHGFELPSVYVVSGSRGKVAASLSLNAVIDDRPDNCLDVRVDSGAMPLLLWRHAPDRLPPGVPGLQLTVVSTMAEAIDHLSHLHSHPSAPRGLLSRLRQALHAS